MGLITPLRAPGFAHSLLWTFLWAFLYTLLCFPAISRVFVGICWSLISDFAFLRGIRGILCWNYRIICRQTRFYRYYPCFHLHLRCIRCFCLYVHLLFISAFRCSCKRIIYHARILRRSAQNLLFYAVLLAFCLLLRFGVRVFARRELKSFVGK